METRTALLPCIRSYSIIPRIFIPAIAFFLILSSSFCLAQVGEDWASHYYSNNRGLSGDSGPGAIAVAVDAVGNVYVAGTSGGPYVNNPDMQPSGGNFATIKYDSNGNALWTAFYYSGGAAWSRALAVDGAGNVYVTGFILVSKTYDWMTSFWLYEYGYVTIKYNSDGHELWTAQHDGGKPYALAVDGEANVYVTGTDATIKYDANGNEIWVVADISCSAMTLDEANIYRTGYYGTGKQGKNGNLVWLDRNESYIGTAISVDSTGNVYTCGQSGSSFTVIKYDPNGLELWTAQHNSSYASALAVDGQGNVYVTGTDATIKYDTNGNQIWVSQYTCRSDSTYLLGRALALDNSGNVYVTGSCYIPSPSNYDGVAVKYDNDGNQLWAVDYESSIFRSIAIDTDENVYVTGDTVQNFLTIKLAQNELDKDQSSDSGASGGMCFISASIWNPSLLERVLSW